MVNLNELSKVALANADLRNKNGGNIKTNTQSMLKHTATEVVEAAMAASVYLDLKSYADFSETDLEEKWPSLEEPDVAEETFRRYKEHLSSELADIICCCLIVAGKEEIDIEKAVWDCIEKNRKRAEGTGDKL